MRTHVPKYRKIIDHVIGQIQRGELICGDQLPTIRELMQTYRVSPNTVVRAMDELALMGLVKRIPGAGTFIRNGGLAIWEPADLKLILDGLDQYEPIIRAGRIFIEVPGHPEQIGICSPYDEIPILVNWPFMVYYSWPHEGPDTSGEMMDLALFHMPGDVVDYVLKVLEKGGHRYKVEAV